MNNLKLTIGSFALIWGYLIFLACTQIYLKNDVLSYTTLLIVLVVLLIWSFFGVRKLVNYKTDSLRNSGLKKFTNIVPERKIGLDFIAANLFPLMDLELFTKISFTAYVSKMVLVVILLAIVTYSRNYAFNPYLRLLGYRVYKSLDREGVLLMKQKDQGNLDSYQSQLNFEEIENSGVFILKDSSSNGGSNK